MWKTWASAGMHVLSFMHMGWGKKEAKTLERKEISIAKTKKYPKELQLLILKRQN